MRITCLLILALLLAACSPGPVSIPTSTTTSTPAPLPTSLATSTPTVIPTITPTLTASPVPNGPCDNPLIPLGAGNQWTYRVTTTLGETRFSLTSLGIQTEANVVARVEYSDQKNNLDSTYPVICKDGGIVDYPLFVMNMLFSGFLDTYISVHHESGNYAPDYQSLIQGDWALTWQTVDRTENKAYIRSPWGQGDLVIPVNTRIGSSFYINNLWETVTTPTGNFPQAVRITQTLTMPVTITASGSGPGNNDNLLIGIALWYVPYTGLVRAQINSVLLGGGKLKLPIDSTLELVEFKPGK
jgi:hypothetical protein